MEASYWDPDSPLWAKYDLGFYRTRFMEGSTRIFSSDKDELEILRSNCWRETEDIGEDSGTENDPGTISETSAQTCIFIIRQNYSWARANIKRESFEKLISDHDIFAPFLNVVHSFGVKTDVDENVWDGFYAALSPESSKDGGKDGCPEKVELCYNIRYVEKHGRQQSCRWSLRQFGIYQSFNPATRHQILIFIQPPDSIYQYLKRHINTPEATDDRGIGLHPISIHAANLSRALNNWDEYIEDLRSELMQLDDKACFSKMGVADKLHDYTITFGDKQKLQLLRHKFLRTLSVLDSTLEVANALMSQFSKFEHPGSQLRDITLAREELNACCSQIRRLRRNASLLLEISTRTDDLLSKILDLRNDRVQCRTSETMLGTLDTLKQIATQSSVAVEQSRKDSKMLKSLTLTMTMYIPATLLATIFSSNLIQLTPDGSGDGKTARFHVVSQFWLYLILTVFLTAVTFVPVLFSRKMRPGWLSIA